MSTTDGYWLASGLVGKIILRLSGDCGPLPVFTFLIVQGGANADHGSLGFRSVKCSKGIYSFIVPSCGCFSISSEALPEPDLAKKGYWFKQHRVKKAEGGIAGRCHMWDTTTVWAGEESGKGLPRSSREAEQVVWCGENAGLRSGSYSEQPDREKMYPLGLWPHWWA